jgi:hypothetical protein
MQLLQQLLQQLSRLPHVQHSCAPQQQHSLGPPEGASGIASACNPAAAPGRCRRCCCRWAVFAGWGCRKIEESLYEGLQESCVLQ